MSDRLWFDCSDSTLPGQILAALGIGHDGNRETNIGRNNTQFVPKPTLADLRQLLRCHGWVMDVRPASPVTASVSSGRAGVRLLVAGNRVLLITQTGRQWHGIDPGRKGWKRPASEVLLHLDRSAMDRYGEQRAQAWQDLAVGRDRIAAVEKKLGLDRASALGTWLRAMHEAVGNPDATVKFALREPDVLPLELPALEDESQPWIEVRFIEQVKLTTERSARQALDQLARSEWRLLFLLFTLTIVSVPLGYGLSLLTVFLVDNARTAFGLPWVVFGILCAVLLLNNALGLVRGFGVVRLAARFRLRVMNAYLFRVLSARVRNLQTFGDGDLFTRLADLFVLQSLVLNSGVPALLTLATLGGGLIYLGTTAPVLFVPLAIAFATVSLFVAVYARRIRSIRRLELSSLSRLRDRLLERLEGRRVLRHFDPMGRWFSRVDSSLAQVSENARRGASLGAELTLLTVIVGAVFLGSSTFIVARQFQSGDASLGGLMVVIGLSAGVFHMMMGLVGLVPAVVAAEPSFQRVREVIKETPPEPFASSRSQRSRGPAALAVDQLSFSWRTGTEVLRQITFHVSPGEWVAIVGASGSGKSTIASVLGGLLEPTSGALVLDGVPLATYAPTVLRRRVAVLTQETFLFDRTIRDNVTLGRADVTDAHVRKAVEMAGLARFIRSRSRGLDHVVGEDGALLSVGEKCRIALARALVRDPGLIVMDEVLSRLDGTTARDIVGRLRECRVSVLMMTHDLLRTRDCNNVLVLRDGCITESGTFAELTRSNGAFARFFEVKNGYYSPLTPGEA